MALILHIDTSMDSASVCLSRDESMISIAQNHSQKDHASWLHTAIEKMMHEHQLSFSNLDAVAVSIGPGSYTGLRVGLSSAKGFCYALNIPLITIGTLEMMANAARQPGELLFCPMIDARRMEVYTALFDANLKAILPPTAMILDASSLSEFLNKYQIVFFGNGYKKFKSIISHPNAIFEDVEITASSMIQLANNKFLLKSFSDLAYTVPLYLKDFYSSSQIK